MVKLSQEEQSKMAIKLQKLLSLATSSNENEANAAMEKAAEMMEKYSLSLADITPDDTNSKESIRERMVQIKIGGLGSRGAVWEAVLANSISTAFDVKLVRLPYRIKTTDGETVDWGLSFMGFIADVEISIWFHKYLRRSIHGKSRMYSNLADKNTFSHGMVSAIHGRLQAMYKKRNEISNSKALIVVKTKAVSDFAKEQYPNLKKRPPSKLRGSRDAWDNGRSEGEKINLTRPIGGSEGTKQIK